MRACCRSQWAGCRNRTVIVVAVSLSPVGRPPSRSGSRPQPGRHRSQTRDAEEVLPDHELESYLAALSPSSDPETTGSGRRFGNAEVYQLRLPLMANEQLREIAAHRHTSPQALAQEWVMQRLQWEAQQLGIAGR